MESLESCRRNLTRRVGGRSEEAALRSEAFSRALINAKACAGNPQSLQALFETAAKKAAAVSKKPFKRNWAYLQTMLRLIRAYHQCEYRQVSNDALVWIIAALNRSEERR